MFSYAGWKQTCALFFIFSRRVFDQSPHYFSLLGDEQEAAHAFGRYAEVALRVVQVGALPFLSHTDLQLFVPGLAGQKNVKGRFYR